MNIIRKFIILLISSQPSVIKPRKLWPYIFEQSKVNGAEYHGDELQDTGIFKFPHNTWFRQRYEHVKWLKNYEE